MTAFAVQVHSILVCWAIIVSFMRFFRVFVVRLGRWRARFLNASKYSVFKNALCRSVCYDLTVRLLLIHPPVTSCMPYMMVNRLNAFFFVCSLVPHCAVMIACTGVRFDCTLLPTWHVASFENFQRQLTAFLSSLQPKTADLIHFAHTATM